MTSVPIEEQRFDDYLRCAERPGSIAHLPRGNTSIFIATPAPYAPVLLGYKILLPYHWPNAQRIREIAMYIAYIELGLWLPPPLDLIANTTRMGLHQHMTVVELADRLIAPQPWLDDIALRYGTTARARRQAARELSIPVESIYSALQAPSSLTADAVHRHIKEVTGYPWFLPPHMRDTYPVNRW